MGDKERNQKLAKAVSETMGPEVGPEEVEGQEAIKKQFAKMTNEILAEGVRAIQTKAEEVMVKNNVDFGNKEAFLIVASLPVDALPHDGEETNYITGVAAKASPVTLHMLAKHAMSQAEELLVSKEQIPGAVFSGSNREAMESFLDDMVENPVYSDAEGPVFDPIETNRIIEASNLGGGFLRKLMRLGGADLAHDFISNLVKLGVDPGENGLESDKPDCNNCEFSDNCEEEDECAMEAVACKNDCYICPIEDLCGPLRLRLSKTRREKYLAVDHDLAQELAEIIAGTKRKGEESLECGGPSKG